MSKSLFLAFLLAATVWFAGISRADEGLWLVNQFPKRAVQDKYGFNVTDEFLQHVQLSSARFNNGGSGSFISPHGLLFTNHHVGADCIQKLSSAHHDYMSSGFYAASLENEQKCPDLEVNVLLKVDEVTAKVDAAMKPGMKPAEANRERKAAMARIEKECTTATGNRCDVVTFYSGGRYDLYQYKKYTDIRLVFAPEADIAAFGGDPDNFTYPRYCLDFALFRAYEKGKPAGTPEYFRWSRTGAEEGELTFVPGNPGNTGRLMTVSQLEMARDRLYPFVLERLSAAIQAIEEYGAQNTENRRAARDNLLYAQNSFKAYTGFLNGLRNPELMNTKRRDEQALRAAVQADPKKRAAYGKVWDQVSAAENEYGRIFKQYLLFERYAGFGSELFPIARDLLRLADERQKPSDRRLREYRDSALPSLEQELYSPAPITDSLEIALLSSYFRFLEKELGTGNKTVNAVLNGRNAETAARAFVSASKLKDIAERKRLAGNPEALRNSDDGMIRLARILDGPAREARRRYEDRVEAVLNESKSALAQAQFSVAGSSMYPDATFTFRIAYGPATGYEVNGRQIPWATVFRGLYGRATGKDPYKLPPRWVETKSVLDLDTPFNFITTADTHGGNSGSPTINTRGEIIGILFDGNLESLPNRFVYNDAEARSVHVASQAIVEALRKVYHGDRVLTELGFNSTK